MERGPGNWPVDLEEAYRECRQKLDKARKEAEHWRDNHKTLKAEVEKLRSQNEMLKDRIEPRRPV
jgi:phage shock protein A